MKLPPEPDKILAEIHGSGLRPFAYQVQAAPGRDEKHNLADRVGMLVAFEAWVAAKENMPMA